MTQPIVDFCREGGLEWTRSRPFLGHLPESFARVWRKMPYDAVRGIDSTRCSRQLTAC
jgi:hypothetical protein